MEQVRSLSTKLTSSYEAWHAKSIIDLNQNQLQAGNRALIESYAMFPAYQHMKTNYLK